jgi:hypothetical protein
MMGIGQAGRLAGIGSIDDAGPILIGAAGTVISG